MRRQDDMDQHQFDLFSKSIGDASTRRGALRLLTGVAGGALAVLLGVPENEAGEAERRKGAGQESRKKKRKRKRKQERRRNRRQGPQPPVTPPVEPPVEPPVDPCDDGLKLCEDSCIPDEDCCTSADCSGNDMCLKGACVKPTLYPNLVTRPVRDLSFDTHPNNASLQILRFSNTVWNAGEGRLELESDVDSQEMPKPIFQNLYNEPVGGIRTERKRVASDFIFHPNHNHFHFKDFAEYLLLGRDATGIYRPVSTEGIKTSFCIMDTGRVSGNNPDQYRTCNADKQGLTPGWSDTYTANLFDQWIVLGDESLSDGEYAVQSIADPKGVIDEGGGARETDNTAITYFTVDGGAIRNTRDQP